MQSCEISSGETSVPFQVVAVDRMVGNAERLSAAASHGLAPRQIRRVLVYIGSNLDSPIRNRDLAAVARLSEFHFNVAFRRSIGRSPHDFVVHCRLEWARNLMLSTDKGLSEIAVECGLADQSHLTRLFHRFFGESPAAWRRARTNACR